MNTANPPRPLTPEELAAFIKLCRELRKWSQEQLAEVAGLSVRTVQRVENGKPTDFDTKRALARALNLEDIDALNKPFRIPTAEELAAAHEAFEREHITLCAWPLDNGRHLATLAATHQLDLCTPGFQMERQAEEVFAALTDYLHEYRDCADLYSETRRLEAYDQFQSYLDSLAQMGVSLRYAVRELSLTASPGPEAQALNMTALYLVSYPKGEEPEEFVTPRQVRVGW